MLKSKLYENIKRKAIGSKLEFNSLDVLSTSKIKYNMTASYQKLFRNSKPHQNMGRKTRGSKHIMKY